MTINAANINAEKLQEIAAAAIVKLENARCADKTRWITAVKKAVLELTENPYWNYDAANFDFVIMSATSNTVYSVNKYCGCAASGKSKPCKHRAMHRLLLRYCETA